MNIEAILARRLAGVATRLIVSERNALRGGHLHHGWPARFLPALIRRTYGQADGVVAVSDGVADDLAAWSGLPRARIVTTTVPWSRTSCGGCSASRSIIRGSSRARRRWS
jgi:Glycosyl transferase 4-like domain